MSNPTRPLTFKIRAPRITWGLSVLDNAITLFFLIEILFRFSVCADSKRFLLDGWNLFDTLVVIGSLVPLDNSEAVLLGRLLRVLHPLPRRIACRASLRSLGEFEGPLAPGNTRAQNGLVMARWKMAMT